MRRFPLKQTNTTRENFSSTKAGMLVFLLMLINASAYSQSFVPGRSNFVFGTSTSNCTGATLTQSGLNFTLSGTNPSLITTVNANFQSNEGLSVHSDRCTGEMQFYSDGINVYNKQGTQFNATSLTTTSCSTGDFQPSSTQGVLIVPRPETPGHYYLFICLPFDDASSPGSGRLNTNAPTVFYYEVDMTVPLSPVTLGYGSIGTRQNLTDETGGTLSGTTEKMVGVRHSNGKDYWVIIHRATQTGLANIGNTNRFLVYKVTRNGICANPGYYDKGQVVSLYNTGTSRYNIACAGYLKASPKGDQLAMAVFSSNVVDLFQFNNTTGVIDQANTYDQLSSTTSATVKTPYGLSFSPDGTKLYCGGDDPLNTTHHCIYEFDVSVAGTRTPTKILDYTTAGISAKQTAAFQLGPDNKLYIAEREATASNNRVIVIDDPNEFSGHSAYTTLLTTTPNAPYPAYMRPIDKDASGGTITGLSGATGNVLRGLPNFIDNDLPEACCIGAAASTTPCTIQYIDGSRTSYSGTDKVVWCGKVYIKGILTFSGNATLDATNVDIIFEPGSGITFSGNAHMSADNSVLRTCEDGETWRGLRFIDYSNAQINNCVIKNAEVAISNGYTSADHATVRITNNLFSNNRIAVYINTAYTTYLTNDENASISGNTFLVDDNAPAFGTSTCSTSTVYYDFYGIQVNNTAYRGLISQNDFVYTSRRQNSFSSSTGKKVYGITALSSGLTVSANKFSNLYRAIDYTTMEGFNSVENNNFEITQDDQTALTMAGGVTATFWQVNINGSGVQSGTQILLRENKFYNGLTFSATSNVTRNAYEYMAIYGNNIQNITILKNEIDGFARAINLNTANGCTVDDNSITNCKLEGITFNSAGPNNTITNNVIKMRSDMTVNANTGPVINAISRGITHYLGQSGTNNVISFNSILDCNISIYLQAIPPSSQLLPVDVRNNYLYNYSYVGLYTENYNGTIGTSCASAALNNPGRNSFISNYVNLPTYLTYDIFAVNSAPALIREFGNYFQANLAGGIAPATNGVGNVQLNSGAAPCTPVNKYFSLAAYAHQNKRLTQPLSSREVFIESVTTKYPLTYDGTAFHCKDEMGEKIEPLSQRERFTIINDVMSILGSNPDLSELDRVYSQYSPKINGNAAAWLRINYLCLKDEYSEASKGLKMIVPADNDEEDLKNIQTIRLSLLSNNRSIKQLDGSEVATLQAIDEKKMTYSNLAREVLNMSQGEHPYILQLADIPAPQLTKDVTRTYFIDDECLDIIPNPVAQECRLRYMLKDISKGQITIYNIEGKVQMTIPVSESANEIKVNTSTLIPGEYIVTISNSNGIQRSAKMIKH